MTNQSLVLQKVTRLSAGNYVCEGRNTEGDGVSEAFPLDVLCKFKYTRFNLMDSPLSREYVCIPEIKFT